MPSCEPIPPLLLLAGPTATGKTALAAEIARRMGGEIISADSMQVYRGCVIGTAQPTPAELGEIPCHLIGCVEPHQTWTVADWLHRTRELITEIQGRGRPVVVAGGTGLYFKALTDGLFEAQGAGRNPDLRRRLEAQWDSDGGIALRRRLQDVDPEAAGRIHANDRLRVVRALEVYETIGRPLTQLQAEARREHRAPPAHRFVLCAGRKDLYARIDQRVEEMMAAGFAREVQRLLARGANEEWPAMRALGYAQMLRLARGQIERSRAVEETKRLSRRYAKQQMILFRQWEGTVWLDAGQGVEKNAHALEIVLEFSPLGDCNERPEHPRPTAGRE